MKALIISYKNELFKERTKHLKKYIKFLLASLDEVVIVAQCWDQATIDEYLAEGEGRLTILPFDKPLGVAEAKNVYLREYFYKSEDPYLLISDDDGYLSDVYDIKDLFSILSTNDQRTQHLDFIVGTNQVLVGYKRVNLEKKELVEKNFTFSKPSLKYLQIFIIRNFKKVYNKEIYFRDTANGKRIHDDLDMILRMKLLGYNIVRCDQFVFYCKFEYSTLRLSDDHIKELDEQSDYTKEMLSNEFHMSVKGLEGTIKKRSYNLLPIRRNYDYVFTERELTINRR